MQQSWAACGGALVVLRRAPWALLARAPTVRASSPCAHAYDDERLSRTASASAFPCVHAYATHLLSHFWLTVTSCAGSR
jgi:hypothetical protein